MPSIAIAVPPVGLVAVPCRYITLVGDTFALHREVKRCRCWPPGPVHQAAAFGEGWAVTDPETGTHIGRGATQGEAVAAARQALLQHGAEAVARQREGLLLSQWGLL